MLADAPPGFGTGIRVSHDGRVSGEMQPHSANHTPLMKARIEADKTGGDVYACPYGCDVEDYDEHGYCHHLVGFSPGREIGYEPVVLCADGRRRHKPRTRKRGPDTVTVWEKCQKDDHLMPIQDKGWARVYRQDVPTPPRPEVPDDVAEDEDASSLEQFLAEQFADLTPEQRAARVAAIQEILTAPE